MAKSTKNSIFLQKKRSNIWWYKKLKLPLHSQLRNSAPVKLLIVWKFG